MCSKDRKALVQDASQPSLLDLPRDIINNELPASLSSTQEALKMMSRLARSCHTYHRLFQPNIDKEAAKQLLSYVLQGNDYQARKMYTINPHLLFIESEAREYAAGIAVDGGVVHRIVKMSPFAAMLGAGDIWMVNTIPHDMLSLIVDKKSRKTFSELALLQLLKYFPNGFDMPQSRYNFTPLVTAINNDQYLRQTGRADINTESLLVQFRQHFLPSTVHAGYLFNMNEMIEALNIYDAYYDLWHTNQLSLFARQIIGYFERLVPAVDAQILCQGILNVTKGATLQRRFDLYNYVSGRAISYFPLDTAPQSRLGLHFLVDCFYDHGMNPGRGNSWLPRLWRGYTPREIVNSYQLLCHIKVNAVKHFHQQLQHLSHHRFCLLS